MIRLVPEKPITLGIGDARDAAKAAFAEARRAQARLVSRLALTERLQDPGLVSYYKLRGMRTQAQEQADRAQAVVDALTRALEALEAAQEDTKG